MIIHSRLGRRQRGIYFISTLIVAVMISMLVMAAISVVRGNLGASRHLSGGDSALKAAESGLRYAQARIGADPTWRAQANAVTVSTPDLIVEERDGNVVGILRAPDGEWAQFRIRFNWQDDLTGDRDGFDDPAAPHRIDNPYVSLNNVAGGSPADVPRGDGPSFAVTDSSSRPYRVPAGTACLLVQGRSGRGLGDLGPGALNPPVAAGGAISSKILESYLRVNNVPGADAAVMAAGDITADLEVGNNKMVVDSQSGTPRVRSKKTIKIEGGSDQENYLSDQGEVHTQDNLLHANYDAQKTDNYVEDDDAEFYKLEWDDVKKAQATDPKIAAGTYVLWDDGSLHYYDLNYDAYVAHIQANPTDAGVPAVLDDKSMELSGHKLTISANTFVESTTASDEFNLIPRGGVQEDVPGAGLSGTVDEQTDTFRSIVSSVAPITVAGGQERASWTIPLAQGFGGTPIVARSGSYAAGTAWDLALTDMGNGTGRLVLNDYYSTNLDFSVDASPDEAFQVATSILAGQNQADYTQMLSIISASGSGMNELDLGAVEPTLKADDIQVEFKPEAGRSAVLSAMGDVRLGSRVEGKGGSITSGGTIRLVGAGSDLSANVEDGLNLYAKGDVVLSSLMAKPNGSYDYKSFKMKGVIYTWGDFKAKIGTDATGVNVNKWGDFKLTGALVAYGSRDQATLGNPGDGAGGQIMIRARKVDLTFDPAYLVALQRVPDPGPLHQTFYTLY